MGSLGAGVDWRVLRPCFLADDIVEWAILEQMLTEGALRPFFLPEDIVEWAVLEQVLIRGPPDHASYPRTSWSGQSWNRC